MEFLSNHFNNLINYSIDHGVEPIVFIFLYITSFPFYYYPLLKLKKYFSKKNKANEIGIKGDLKKDLVKYIIINRLAWAAPYLYVVICGYGLPKYLVILVWAYLFMGVVLFIVKYGGFLKNEDRIS